MLVLNETTAEIPLKTNYGHLAFCCSILIIAAVGNGATIVAFAFDKKLRFKPSETILLALSVSDFLLDTIVVPVEIAAIVQVGFWPLGKPACHLMIVLSYTLVTASVYFTILFSWDRYRLVSLNYSSYLKSQSFKKHYCLILITVSVASIPGILETAMLKSLTPSTYDNIFNCIIPSAYYLYLAFTLTASYSIIPVIFVTTFVVLFFKNLMRRIKRWTQEHKTNNTNGCSIIRVGHI